MRQKLSVTAVLLVLVIVLGISAVHARAQKRPLSFPESLEKVAVTVDGRELTLQELAFYIAYEEQKMEAEARVYNPKNTGEYWNLYTNHTFFREKGKQMVIDMAVHDEIFYQLAMSEEMELTADEESYLANSQYDFWSDLEEEQRQALGVGEDVLKESMRRIALAEKYQYLLAEMNQKDFEEYSVGGEAYLRMLEEHTYEVDESVWDRIRFGSITVDH